MDWQLKLFLICWDPKLGTDRNQTERKNKYVVRSIKIGTNRNEMILTSDGKFKTATNQNWFLFEILRKIKINANDRHKF